MGKVYVLCLYTVYILASQKGGTLYIGSTNDLVRRVYEHKQKYVKGFTEKYNIIKLVYFEQFEEMGLAAQRERNLKHWYRKWKIALIEKQNPEWDDLFEEIAAV